MEDGDDDDNDDDHDHNDHGDDDEEDDLLLLLILLLLHDYKGQNSFHPELLTPSHVDPSHVTGRT